jgi:hypothetical protein
MTICEIEQLRRSDTNREKTNPPREMDTILSIFLVLIFDTAVIVSFSTCVQESL